MTSSDHWSEDVVLAAWAPAGWGRIVVVLGQGVVIHTFVVSGRAAAQGIAETLTGDFGTPRGERDTAIATSSELRSSPFIDKVLRHGVDGLLASPRKTLIPWDGIISVEYRGLALNRGRMVIRTANAAYKLKFLQNTVVAGDPATAFTHHLGDRFTDSSAG